MFRAGQEEIDEKTNRSRIRGDTDQAGSHGAVSRIDAAANLWNGPTGYRDRLTGQDDVGRHGEKERMEGAGGKRVWGIANPRLPE